MKRTIMTKALSLLVTVTMLCAMLVVGAPAASAATTIPSISAGGTWSDSWSSYQDGTYLDLEVYETGLYTLTITDYMQTGMVYIGIQDITTESYFGYIEETIGSTPYVSSEMMMQSGHVYSLSIGYYDEEWNLCAADMSILFEKASAEPTLLPNVPVNSSRVMISLDEGDSEWFRFTPDATGDYTINFSSSLGAYIYLYDPVTGDELDGRDTQYSYYGSWNNGNRAAFYLEANKEYYFRVVNYEGAVSAKISITKNAKSVLNITIGDADRVLECGIGSDIWSYARNYFYYNVYYRDGSSETLHYSSLCGLGLELPYVDYMGDVIYPNNEEMLVAGNRAVVAYYGDEVSYSTIKVTSITDWLVDIDANAIDEYDGCYFSNDGEVDDLGYYRIKVSKTGVYNVWSGDWELLDDYTFMFLDKQNNPVKYVSGGYPLVAGQEYALSFRTTFNDGEWDDFDFYLKCEKTTMFPDAAANAWYSDAVNYSVGRGIISGYQNGKLGTGDGIQRQDFLVMLARLDGVDLEYYAAQHGLFPDVAKNSYYEAAVTWGYENGIVTGYNDGRFGVGDKITREQLVTFIQRYAKYKGYDTSASAGVQNTISGTYKDFKNVSAFAKESMVWAIDNGVMKGKTANTIVPQGNAQRCEVAQIMYNIFVNNVL